MELCCKDLKRNISEDIKNLGIKSVADIEKCSELIGQNRAAAAFDFGLSIKRRGYNIFVTGLVGSGRTSFAERFAKKHALDEPIPDDICYVYNFSDPKVPLAIHAKAGTGAGFKEDMSLLIEEIESKLKKTFQSREFEEEKNALTKKFSDKRDELLQIISDQASLREFGVKLTNSGVFFMPLVKGEPLSEEQYDVLSASEKKDLTKKSDEIQTEASKLMFEIKDLDSLTQTKVSELGYRSALLIIGNHFVQILAKYEHEPNILSYLKQAKEDMIESYEGFAEETESEEAALSALLPISIKKNIDNTKSKFLVNLFVDNSALSHAPVVSSKNLSSQNFMGDMEFDNENGNFSTDYMKIKPGLIHKANGGYLILQEEDVFSSHIIWNTIKKLLKTGEVQQEPLRELTTGLTVSAFKPKPLALDVKIIIIGSHHYYNFLFAFEDDFKKLFRINAAFDYEIDMNEKNLAGTLGFIKKFIADESLKDFSLQAITTVAAHFLRLAESKKNLTAEFHKIAELLIEASHLASGQVEKSDVEQALTNFEYRNNLYKQKLDEMVEDNIVMIDTSGSVVGQINGLSVIMTENIAFGKPSRITATTYVGKSGLINIEKEAKLSGSTHDKGVEVISGYLGQMYAQEFPLSLSCRICFEQNYGGIDGDSASAAELYAILSSLADLPIAQQFAVTGSVNQRGEIQAIGGITEKIEGFYDLCKARGLTGHQGIIMPAQNIGELCLKDEIVESVQNQRFHIHAIKTIDEGIELLTGKKAGSRNAQGKFPSDTIHGMVLNKLKNFHKFSVSDQI